MAKQHKYHHSRIDIATSLSSERALDIARQAVSTQSHLALDDAYEEGFSVLVKSWTNATLLHFTVFARNEGQGTRILTEVQEYRTSQTTVFFIPIGPKSMLGYAEYRRYMITLGQLIAAADPHAQSAIVETQEVHS